jgi:hypothetical protein
LVVNTTKVAETGRLFADSPYIRYNGCVTYGLHSPVVPQANEYEDAMGKQKSKDNPYSGIAEKVEKIMAGIADQMPKLSANDLAVVQRAIKFLARNTRAGAERLAILHLLGTNEVVPGTMLYQLCSRRVEKRVRELQSIGMDIRRWSEIRPDGCAHSVYGWSGFRVWQEHRLLNETEEQQPSLKRVM